MSDDIRRLFELAEREMRPELRADLLDLLDTEDRAAAPSSSSAEETDLIVGPDPDRRPRGGRGWHPGVWLGVAATFAVVLALAVAPGGSDNEVAPTQTPSTVPAPGEACALEAGALDVVTTSTGDIRVGLMPDGSSFCLIDDSTGEEITVPTIDDAAPAGVQVIQPAIVGFGIAGPTAYYFVVAIPDGMPASTILAPTGQARSFATQVGRRFLVIDTDYDLRRTPQHVTHDLTVYSGAGAVLATLIADIDELTRSRTEGAP